MEYLCVSGVVLVNNLDLLQWQHYMMLSNIIILLLWSIQFGMNKPEVAVYCNFKVQDSV